MTISNKKVFLLGSLLFLSFSIYAQTYFAVSNKNSLATYTAYNISESLNDLKSAISSRKSQSYILSSLTYTDQGWFSIYTKGSEFSEGILVYSTTISDLRNQISAKWKSNYNLGPVTYGSGYWAAVMFKSSTHYTSSYNTSDTKSELFSEISGRLNDGFLLESVAYDGSKYFATFRKTNGTSGCKYFRSPNKEGIGTVIKNNWVNGYDLYNVFYVKDEYFAVMHKANHLTSSAYNYEVDLTVLRTAIKSRWDAGYDLAHLAFEPSSSFNSVITQTDIPEVKTEIKEMKTVFSLGGNSWNIKNLSVTKFRNGDEIPLVTSEEEWFQASQNGEPAYCYVNGDPSTVVEYGLLYNWYAVHDSRGLAPEGFRLATNNDFQKLMDEVTSNTSMNNQSLILNYGFVNTGCRVYKGQFRFFNVNSMWWAKNDPASTAVCFKYDPNSRSMTKQEFFKGIGLPVKIIQE